MGALSSLYRFTLPRMPPLDIHRLTPTERLELLERLWDSLSEAPETVPVTDAQRGELDRRLDDLEREGPAGIPWEEVVRRLRRKK